MMKMAIHVTVLFLLSTVLCHPVHGAHISDHYPDNEARILILGAGAAGLQTARTLHDAGMDDFIIIEAADRIGGRVHDTQFAGMNVELGAGWAYANSRTIDIVEDLDLNRTANNYDSFTFRNDTGHNVTDEAFSAYDRFEKAVEKLKSLRDRMNENDDIPDMSQRSALRLGGWIPETAIDQVIEWFDFDFEYAETTDVCSTKLIQNSGEEYFMKDEGGYKQIFYDVSGFLKEPEYINHTRLNQKVLSIDYSNDVSVVVTCEDGTRYIGEYVLVTFSIGVLQSDSVRFIPPLPEWKDVIINKFHMAAYSHIYLSFPSKFWDDTEWIVHASDRRGYYPLFFNFQSEGFYPEGTPMLMADVTGDESRRIEAQPLSKTKSEVENVLRNLYGDDAPDATDILVSDWTQNPLTKGSYTNWPVEVSTECHKKLESRVHRVFFGGEGTSSTYYGFIAGALESGEREARKILGCMEDFARCPIFEGDGLECEAPVPKTNSASTLYCQAFLAGILAAIFLKK